MKQVTKSKSLIWYLFIGTILSALVFFSISFLTLLLDLKTFNPYAVNGKYHFEIGFPLTYYREFYMEGNTFPSSDWNPFYLLLDCFITWIMVTLPYTLIKMRRKRLEFIKTNQEEQLIDR